MKEGRTASVSVIKCYNNSAEQTTPKLNGKKQWTLIFLPLRLAGKALLEATSLLDEDESLRMTQVYLSPCFPWISPTRVCYFHGKLQENRKLSTCCLLSPLESLLSTFHWPKQVTWPSPHQWQDVYSTHTKGDTVKSLGKECECKIRTHEGSEEWWTMMHPMTEDNQHCQEMQLSVAWVSHDLPVAC